MGSNRGYSRRRRIRQRVAKITDRDGSRAYGRTGRKFRAGSDIVGSGSGHSQLNQGNQMEELGLHQFHDGMMLGIA